MDDDLREAYEAARSDFAAVNGAPFRHFYCPILQVDEPCEVGQPGELVKGHIIPDALGGRVWVPQRKDVDNFYGEKVESDFIGAIRDRGKSVLKLWHDPDSRRRHNPVFMFNNERVQDYRPGKIESIPDGFSSGRIVIGEGVNEESVRFVLKKPLHEIFGHGDSEATINLIVDRDYVPVAIAAGIKAAHLTCFKLYGYRYVKSPAGLFLASILRDFYQDHRNTRKRDMHEPLSQYFMEHRSMFHPIFTTDGTSPPFQGTLADRKVIHFISQTGRAFAIGVLVKAGNDDVFIVCLPGEDNAIDTYFDFLKCPPESVLVGIGPLFPLGGDPENRSRIALPPPHDD